jgi:hypothetical protein
VKSFWTLRHSDSIDMMLDKFWIERGYCSVSDKLHEKEVRSWRRPTESWKARLAW